MLIYNVGRVKLCVFLVVNVLKSHPSCELVKVTQEFFFFFNLSFICHGPYSTDFFCSLRGRPGPTALKIRSRIFFIVDTNCNDEINYAGCREGRPCQNFGRVPFNAGCTEGKPCLKFGWIFFFSSW